MIKTRPQFLLWVLLTWCSTATATVTATDSERAVLRSQRAEVEQRFLSAERACQSRFFVNACFSDARSEQRQALAPLRERELNLDQAERQQRADQRRAGVANKLDEAAARATAASSAPQSPARGDGTRERLPAAAPAGAVSAQAQAAQAGQAVQAAQAEKAAAAALAAKRLQATQRRAEAAAQAQARVDKRLQQRAARGKTVVPLPVPAAASAARR